MCKKEMKERLFQGGQFAFLNSLGEQLAALFEHLRVMIQSKGYDSPQMARSGYVLVYP